MIDTQFVTVVSREFSLEELANVARGGI